MLARRNDGGPDALLNVARTYSPALAACVPRGADTTYEPTFRRPVPQLWSTPAVNILPPFLSKHARQEAKLQG